jgi:hypothetical protein
VAGRGEYYVKHVLHVWHVIYFAWRVVPMAAPRSKDNQNVTISLSRQVLRKAKILAARRDTSISGLLSQAVESMVADEEGYEQAKRRAFALLDKGFRLGGVIAPREDLHER